MSGATGARVVAAVGVVCGLVAIWIDAGAGGGTASYWNDHSLGVTMLALEILAGLFLFDAQVTNRHGCDVAAGVFGGIYFGFALYIPVFWSPSTLHHVGVGGWLGLCSVLTPLAMLSLPPPGPLPVVRRSVYRLGGLLALAGAGLAIGSIWLGWNSSNLTYWSRALQTQGICLLVLSALAAVLVAAALVRPVPPFVLDAALVVAGVALGFAGYLLANAAFNHLGSLGAGAWLGTAGALLMLVGVLVMRGSFVALRRRPRPAPAPA
jgi:hypothetical protein